MGIMTDLCHITVGRVYHGEVCQECSQVGYHPLHRTSLLGERGKGGNLVNSAMYIEVDGTHDESFPLLQESHLNLHGLAFCECIGGRGKIPGLFPSRCTLRWVYCKY